MIIALIRKELNSFFSSLTGYLAISVFLIVTGLFLWVFPGQYNIADYGQSSLEGLFTIAPLVFLILIPAITMRLLAEERKSGTMELLLTRPISDYQLIFSKFLAGWTVSLLAILPTMIYFLSVWLLGSPQGNIDTGATLGSYLGLLLLAGSFVAIGVFCSATTSNQVVAFILAFLLSAFLFVGFDLIHTLRLFGRSSYFLQQLGMNAHFTALSRGVIDSRDVIYFVSIIALFILLAKLWLSSRKWQSAAAPALSSHRSLSVRSVSILWFAGFLVLISFIHIAGQKANIRFDLTSERRHTLSPVTKALIRDVRETMVFRIYLDGNFPAGFVRLRNSVREMLDELHSHNNLIRYELIDPLANEKQGKTDTLQQYLFSQGLTPFQLNVTASGQQKTQVIYPGAIVSYQGRTATLEFLSAQLGQQPDAVINKSVENLEYKLAITIKKLLNTTKPRVAFIQGHGELTPWQLASAQEILGEFYETGFVTLDGAISSLLSRSAEVSPGIWLPRYAAIVIAKPRYPFSEADKYVIDQYIMHGGKVFWALDAVSTSMDSLQAAGQTLALPLEINLTDQLFRYGVKLGSTLLMDLTALPIPIVTGTVGNQPQFTPYPWYYFPLLFPASDFPLVKNINASIGHFISPVEVVETPGVSTRHLLTTSGYTRMQTVPAMISLEILKRDPVQSEFNAGRIPVATLLEGNFRSLWANRLPPTAGLNDYRPLTESFPSAMIVVADGDIVRNQASSTQSFPYPLGYDHFSGQQYGNNDFFLNAINYFADESGIIGIRSRNVLYRKLDTLSFNKNKAAWQILNVALPVLLLIAFGKVAHWIRINKFTRK